MPISKDCIYCIHNEKLTGLVHCYVCNGKFTDFEPTSDWLYIEQLEKENEELKKYKEETEKWLGSSPYIYVNEDEVKE